MTIRGSMTVWRVGMTAWQVEMTVNLTTDRKTNRCRRRQGLSGRRQLFRVGNVAGGFPDAALGIVQRLAKPQIETVAVQNTLPGVIAFYQSANCRI